MWVFNEEGTEHGKRFRRSAPIKGDVTAILKAELKRLAEKGYNCEPLDDGKHFHVTGDDMTDYTVCAYHVEELVIEPYIMSTFYHLHDNFYVEVLRDTPNSNVVVYLYPAGIPGGKEEIARMDMRPETANDDEIIAGLMLRIEDKAKEIEKYAL